MLPASTARRLTASIIGLFGFHGLTVGCYVGALPAMRVRLQLSPVGVGIILLCVGAAALVAMQVTGPWAEKHGARRAALGAPPVMAVGILLFSVAPTFPLAVAAATLYGVGNGMSDVAMNALGVEVEQRVKRTRMGAFHGCWALGCSIAALIVVAFGPLSAHVWPPVVTGVALAAVVIGSVVRWVPESRTMDKHDQGRGRLPRSTWLLGFMAIGFGFTEGTGFDWSSLHVAAVTRAPSNLAALGLACMSGMMVVIRLLGDHLVDRFGRRRVVVVSATVAAVGYAITLVATPLPVVLLGWLLVGLGCGSIAPQIYGLAGHIGGPRMLGVVVGFGYTAFLACPAIVGAVGDAFGLQRAMAVPLAAAVGLLLLGWFMPNAPHTADDRPEG